MTASTDYIGALSPEAEAALAVREMFSQVAQHGGGALADIFTCDGDRVVTVTRTIGAADLNALITHGRREYDRGAAAGMDNARGIMRRALGLE
jgi:hypothetical protein